MQRRAKFFVYLTMLVIAAYVFLFKSAFLGFLLILLIIMGSIFIDVLQVKRVTPIIMRKLYICLDYEAYDLMVKGLNETLFYKQIVDLNTTFFTMLSDHYKNRESKGINEAKTLIFKKFGLNIWKLYAHLILMQKSDEKVNCSLKVRQRSHKISKQYEVYYSDYICQMIRIRGLDVAEQITELNELREQIENKLQFAQVNKWLSEIEPNSRRAAYYKKAAQNLAPELFVD